MKQTIQRCSSALTRMLLILMLLLTGSASAWGENFSTTYSYGLSGWSLTNYTDQSSYYQVPTGTNVTTSVATISGIFSGKTITSDVVVTINCATYGKGTDPSDATFSLYKETACTNLITASQGGTLPTSSTYTNVTYTVTQANAQSLGSDLAIKITKPGKTIRLKSIKVEFTYTTTGGGDPGPTSYTISLDANIEGGTIASDKTSAEEGATVTLTATPEDGYSFGSWNVINATTSEEIAVTDNTFTMPAANVNVSATFTEDEPGENQLVIRYNFNDANAYPAGFPKGGTQTANAQTFNIGGNNIIINANNSYYIINSTTENRGLFFGKTTCSNSIPTSSTSYLGFPAKNGYKLVKVVATSTTGIAANLPLNIYTTSLEAVSDASNTVSGAKTAHIFNLTNSTGNTEYWLTAGGASGKNLQFDNIVLTYEKTIPDPVRVLTGITIKGEASNTEYSVGDKFNKEGLSVEAQFKNGDTGDVTNSAEWSIEPDILTYGTNQVSITATYSENEIVKSDAKEIIITVNKLTPSITIADLTINIGESVSINATTTPNDAELTYNIKEGDDYISLDGNLIRGIAEGTATVTAHYEGNSNYKETEKDFRVTVSNTQLTTYDITIASDLEGGSITADKTSAEEGATVTLTATPEDGYSFGSWNVINAATSEEIAVTDNTFTMPAASVNVSATFNVIINNAELPHTATFNGKDATYTEGWTTTGTGDGRTDCIIIGMDENITSPYFDLSSYATITITFTGRRYGTLSNSKAVVDASIAGSSVGTIDITGTSVAKVTGSIQFSPTSQMTNVQLVFTCTNATSAGSTHGAGIGSITITGTLPSSDPSIDPIEDVNLSFDATSGEFSYSITNPDGSSITAEEKDDVDWITNVTVDEANSKVTFDVEQNEGLARETIITLHYGSLSRDVTIKQTKVNRDYTSLPLNIAEGKTSAELKEQFGVSLACDGTDYNNDTHKVKFSKNTHYLQIKTNERIGAVTFSIKGCAGAGSSTFALQESVDGSSWTDIEEITATFAAQNDVVEIGNSKPLNENSRYIKLAFLKKTGEVNCGLGSFSIDKYKEENISISQYGLATCVTGSPLIFTDSGVTAYKLSVDSNAGTVTLTSVAQAPAGTPLLVSGEKVSGEEVSYSVPVIGSAADVETDLKCSDGTATSSAETTIYYLGVVDGKATFKPLANNGSKLAPGKCYFEVPSSAPTLHIVIDDEEEGNATAIASIGVESLEEATYDLLGQKNSNAKGLMIRNGKVIFVK